MEKSVLQARWILGPVFVLCLGFVSLGFIAG